MGLSLPPDERFFLVVVCEQEGARHLKMRMFLPKHVFLSVFALQERRPEHLPRMCRALSFPWMCRARSFPRVCRARSFPGVCRARSFPGVCRARLFPGVCRARLFPRVCRARSFPWLMLPGSGPREPSA